MKRSVLASFAIASLTLASNAFADTTIDDFESADAPSPWVFYNGAEFPGATGSLTKGAGHTGAGAHLAFDFTGGGAYVAANLTLKTPIDAAAIAYWAKGPAGLRVTLRVTDSSGQTLQYEVARPLSSVDEAAWYRQVVALDASTSHWDGANDGTVHAPIKAISILAADPVAPKMVGAIDFDEVVAIDALGAAIDLSPPAFSAPSGAESLAPRLGVNIHFFKDDTGLDAAHDMGFTRARMDLFWQGVETTKGVYDFSQVDALVASLAARGMRLHLILDYTNPLYPLTSDAAFVSTTVPAFAAMSKAIAAHLQGKNVTYEVWNEANGAGFWPPAPDPVAYAALSKAAIAAVHSGDPSALVSTTGLAGVDITFARAMFAAGGATGANAIGVHPYRQSGPETATDDLLLLRSMAAALPGKPPLWDTEWGYSSQWFGDGHDPANRATQARMAARELLTAWALGFPLAVYYDLRDDGTDPTNGEHNFGLLANDYTDKPAAVAVRTLTKIANGRTFVGTYDLAPTTLHAMRLDGTDDVVIAVWAERGSVPVTLPKGAHAVDMNGADVDVSSGSITVREQDGPTYVVVINPSVGDAGSDASIADGGADAGSNDDATIADTSIPNDASIHEGAPTGSSSGCGCAIVGARAEGSIGVVSAIAALAIALRRRRQRDVAE